MQKLKHTAESVKCIRLELEPGWWWRDRGNFHHVLAVLFDAGETPEPEYARTVFKAEFEYSAWKYEAHRRFHNLHLPPYPKLPAAEMLRLSKKWPDPGWRERTKEIHPSRFAEDQEPGSSKHPLLHKRGPTPDPGWTGYRAISFDLRLRNSELLDAVKEYIMRERKSKGIPEPKRPGRPTKLPWKALEDFDMSERIEGYLAGDPSARSQLSKAQRIAPKTLK